MRLDNLFHITLDLATGGFRVYNKINNNYYPLGPDERNLRVFMLKGIKREVDKKLEWIDPEEKKKESSK